MAITMIDHPSIKPLYLIAQTAFAWAGVPQNGIAFS